jgi:hypothetical protein
MKAIGKRGLAAWALGLSVAFAAVFALVRPGESEQDAMYWRGLVEKADALARDGDAAASYAILESAIDGKTPRKDVALRLFSGYAATGQTSKHAALLTRVGPEAAGSEALAFAEMHYRDEALVKARSLAIAALAKQAENRFQSGSPASVSQMAALLERSIQRQDDRAVGAVAAGLAKELKPAERPDLATQVVSALSRLGEASAADAFVARWMGPSPGSSELIQIAQVLSASGREPAALSLLRDHQAVSPDVATAYYQHLRNQAGVDREARAELTQRLLGVVLDGKTDEPASASAFYDLLQFGDLDAIVPALEVGGAWKRDDIREPLLARLAALKRNADIRRLVTADLGLHPTAQQTRSAIDLYQRMALVEDAERLAAGLARVEGPLAASTQELFYRWAGSKAPDTAWLAARLAESTPQEFGQWLDAMERSLPDHVVRAIDVAWPSLDASQRGLAFVRKARYLGWQEDSARLSELLRQTPYGQLSQASLSEIGNLACFTQQKTVVEQVALRLDNPPLDFRRCKDGMALEEARLAARQGDEVRALVLISRLDLGEATLSPSDRVMFAGLLDKAGGDRAARFQLNQAAEGLKATPASSDGDVARASILIQLGRTDDAQRVLEDAVADGRANRTTRLMLSQMLNERGQYQRSLDLLCERDACPAAKRAQPGGAAGE